MSLDMKLEGGSGKKLKRKILDNDTVFSMKNIKRWKSHRYITPRRTGGILDIRNYRKDRFNRQNPKLDGLET